MVVFVEQSVLEDPLLQKNEMFDPIRDKLCTFNEGQDDLTDKIDFIICLGGDGTLLYASSLFQVGTHKTFHLFRGLHALTYDFLSNFSKAFLRLWHSILALSDF